MKILNVLGMLLQFFAFWFAAPELLGVDKLKKWEEKIVNFTTKLPAIALGVPGVVLISIFIISSGEKGRISLSLPLVVVAFVLLRKRLQQKIQEKLITPFFDILLESDYTRQKYLRYGAFLFTIGFFLSLTAAVLG